MGSTSSDGTTVVDIQVQTCKVNEIQLETLDKTKSSTPLSTIEISTLAIQNTSVDSDQKRILHWRNMIRIHHPYGLSIPPTVMTC